MQKTDKKETLELYRDHNTQILLSKFLSGEIKTLEPVYDPPSGYRYQVIEKIVGDRFARGTFLKQTSPSRDLGKATL